VDVDDGYMNALCDAEAKLFPALMRIFFG